MRFVSYLGAAEAHTRRAMMGVVIGDAMAPLASIDEFYGDVSKWTAAASRVSEGSIPLTSLDLAPPVPWDAKIVCAAVNYVAHGKEANITPPSFPNLFARWASEMIVDGANVAVPEAEPDGLDWEVELAVLIGETALDVDATDAAGKVFGYTVANDISGRASQLQALSIGTGQWALGKNIDKSLAVGSFIETPDAVDASDLHVETTVDGKIMQSGTTGDMIFSVSDLIAFTSRHVTLRPGDMILTGTPEGVGFGRNPRIYMKPGSVVTVSVGGVCSITNRIVDSSHRGASRGANQR